MPSDARSSAYCTDVAKMIDAPIFHVNGDSPLEVAYVTELAMEYRKTFGRDVVIDIVCYRKHGHNESDEPAFTQPKIYRAIRNKKSTLNIYRDYLLDRSEVKESDIDEITMIEIRVQDSGCGFDKESLGQIFDPYVTSKSKGTGLGLAIVKKLVEEHMGTIEAENNEDKGAAIIFHLPKNEMMREKIIKNLKQNKDRGVQAR